MKVLMVSDAIVGNGIGSVVYRLYNSLHNRNVQCDVICYQDLSSHKDIVELFNQNGDKIIRIPSVSRGVFSYIKNIRKICKKGKYDAVHIHTSLLIFLAAYAAKKEGIPVIIGHAHGAKFLNYPEIVLKILEPIGRFLNNKYCTDFVTCSQVSAKYTFGHEAIFIPNYVPTNEIMNVSEMDISDLRKKYCGTKKIVFGYMGSLDGIKNATFLPEVANALKKQGMDVFFVLVGTGVEFDNIARKVVELKCENNMLMLGYMSNCNELVQVFDYYISASKSEGMSLSMIEAQMSGKPCFVSSLIPNDSDLNIGLFYKIDGYDKDEWASRIKEYIASGLEPISRDEAYEKIKTNHLTESDVMNDLISVYENRKKK